MKIVGAEMYIVQSGVACATEDCVFIFHLLREHDGKGEPCRKGFLIKTLRRISH